MVVSHLRSRRTPTGSRYKTARGRRLAELGSLPTMTKVGESKSKTVRGRSASTKQRLLNVNIANVFDAKSKKYIKSEVEKVIECPANRNYARRNILVKGTIIQTKAGKARITNRPGQEGTLNAVLVE